MNAPFHSSPQESSENSRNGLNPGLPQSSRKWMLGAAAVSSTATGGFALAETVQITQTGNKISGPTDFAAELRADLTGDMTADLRNLYQTIRNTMTMRGSSYGQIDGVVAQFYSSGSATVRLALHFSMRGLLLSVRLLIPSSPHLPEPRPHLHTARLPLQMD